MMKYTSSRFLASSALMLLFTISGAYAQTNVSQTGSKGAAGVINSGDVSNTGVVNVNKAGTSGIGASVSIGATGAAGSVSSSAVAVQSAPAVTLGTVKQSIENKGSINNDATVGTASKSTLNTGASVSASASGAAASVSHLAVKSPVSVLRATDAIVQNAQNSGAGVTNTAVTNLKGLTLAGSGASVSVGASGAVSSVTSTSIAGSAAALNGLKLQNGITQESGNTALIQNTALSDVKVGNVSGMGASVSVTASGASAAVSASSIQSGPLALRIKNAAVDQSSVNLAGVKNISKGVVRGGNVSGNAAAVQIVASGASASIGSNLVNKGGAAAQYANAVKIDKNMFQYSANRGFVANSGKVNLKDLSGVSASAQISAIGASTALSASSVNGGGVSLRAGPVDQLAVNLGFDSAGGISITNAGTIKLGQLSGMGSSASVTAVGASSSLSLASIGGGAISSNLGSVKQTVLNGDSMLANKGSVLNTGFVTAGNLSGTASAIQVASIGASASVSMSSIAPKAASFGGVNVGPVAQTVANAVSVTNYGDVNAGMVSGTASSIGVSATGASASVSFSAIGR